MRQGASASSATPPIERPLRRRIAAGIGLCGLALVFMLGLRSPTAFYLGLLLALAGLALAADRTGPALTREPLVWFAIVLVGWVIIRGWLDLSTATARGLEPDADAIWHHARYTPLLAVILGFWLAAWWHYRQILLILIGLAATIYVVDSWDRLLRGLPGGERPFASAFGEAGVIAATVVFLTAAASLMALQAIRSKQSFGQWVLFALGIGLTQFLVFVLIASQARAAWLAVFASLIALTLPCIWYLWTHADGAQRRLALVAGAGSTLLVAIAAAMSWDIIAGRMARDSQTISVLLSGQASPDDIPGGSLGDRYRMFRQGLIDIADNPLWGVGPASVRDMLHEIWGKDRGGSGNYHSTWLNLMVAMGIPWTLFWIGVHCWILARAIRELVVTEGERVLAVAVLGAALTHFATITFQVRIWSINGSVLYLIVMALACAVLLRGAVYRAGFAATGR